MTPRPDIRVVVDALLKVDKEPYGFAQWAETDRDGDMRLQYPLLVGGEISDATLTIKAYPRHREIRFRIILTYGKAIWRLDYVDDENHINSFDRPNNLPTGPINEPHYHSWADNRRFATASRLPEKLLNANILPRNIRTFENAYRWFCGETNIKLSEFELPELPPTDKLI